MYKRQDILIADEPTTALDVTIQAQILELMQSLQKKLGMAIIMVTHEDVYKRQPFISRRSTFDMA